MHLVMMWWMHSVAFGCSILQHGETTGFNLGTGSCMVEFTQFSLKYKQIFF